MAVTWYLCHAIWLMWQYSHSWLSRVSMIVADGLAPIWCHNICKHHYDTAQSACIRSAQHNKVLHTLVGTASWTLSTDILWPRLTAIACHQGCAKRLWKSLGDGDIFRTWNKGEMCGTGSEGRDSMGRDSAEVVEVRWQIVRIYMLSVISSDVR